MTVLKTTPYALKSEEVLANLEIYLYVIVSISLTHVKCFVLFFFCYTLSLRSHQYTSTQTASHTPLRPGYHQPSTSHQPGIPHALPSGAGPHLRCRRRGLSSQHISSIQARMLQELELLSLRSLFKFRSSSGQNGEWRQQMEIVFPGSQPKSKKGCI